jgi:hypothetical protein
MTPDVSSILAGTARHPLALRERDWRNETFEISCQDLVHCGLMPANFTTFAHFSVSAAMKLTNSSGEPANALPPRSASRALFLGSARTASISQLSLSTISEDVCSHIGF